MSDTSAVRWVEMPCSVCGDPTEVPEGQISPVSICLSCAANSS